MKIKILLFISFIIILISCTTPNFNNPFDPKNDGSNSGGSVQGASDFVVNIGDNASFTIIINGQYQSIEWFKEDSPSALEGNSTRNSEELILNNVQKIDEGRYFARVTFEDSHTEESRHAMLSVKDKDEQLFGITTQPTNVYAAPGDKPSFTCIVSGNEGDVEYRWGWSNDGGQYWNGTDDGYNDSILNLEEVSTADNGMLFRCIVEDMNTHKLDTSSTVTLYVNEGANSLTITSDITDTVVSVGESAKFKISVSGDSPFTYVWVYNANEVSRKDSTTNIDESWSYSPQNSGDSGWVQCTVTDKYGNSVVSVSAKLSVKYEPKIDSQSPTFIKRYEGDTVNLFVSATGAISYHWQENINTNWIDISPEENGANFNLTVNTTEGTSNKQYRCVVKFDNNIEISSDMIEVQSISVINVKPIDLDTLSSGDTLKADLQTQNETSRKWQKYNKYTNSWEDFTGPTSNDRSFRHPLMMADTGKIVYRCVVSDSASSGISNIDSVVVIPDLSVVGISPNDTIYDSDNTHLFAAINGVVSYRWQIRFDGSSWLDFKDSLGNLMERDTVIFTPKLGDSGSKFFRCIGVAGNGDSIITDEIEIFVKVIPAPHSVSINYASAVIFKWERVDIADGYNVYRSTMESGPWDKINDSIILNTPSDTLEFRDSLVDTGVEYWYNVKSVQEGRLSKESISLKITIP